MKNYKELFFVRAICGGHDQTRMQAKSKIHMKTQGEIEAAICSGMSRFEQKYMGRGPKDVSHLPDG